MSKSKNGKALLSILLHLILVSACCIFVILYSKTLPRNIDIRLLLPVFLGAILMTVGAFLPRAKQNTIFGIRISWTLDNKENWNKTHRFAGTLWILCGFIILLSALLPLIWMLIITLVSLLLICLLPMVYSYRIYKKHKQSAISYTQPVKWQTIVIPVLIILLITILMGSAIVMFTGEITYAYDRNVVLVDGDYIDAFMIPYTEMDDIFLYTKFDRGTWHSGFLSPRLSIGSYENDAHGKYTMYAYNSCEAMVVIKTGDEVIALNGKNLGATLDLFDMLKKTKP